MNTPLQARFFHPLRPSDPGKKGLVYSFTQPLKDQMSTQPDHSQNHGQDAHPQIDRPLIRWGDLTNCPWQDQQDQ